MKHLYYALLLWTTLANAQSADTTFVYLNNGCEDAYPADLATVGDMFDGTLEVTWNDNTVEWDAAFKGMNDPSGRAVKGVHEQAY